MKKQKFYVVWKGRKTGVFKTWAECQKQIINFPGALYRSYESLSEAEKAARGKPQFNSRNKTDEQLFDRVPDPSAYCVDAACSGNPGKMEYRCVSLADKEEIFRSRVWPEGTNNIGEFLAVVHIAARLMKLNDASPIYSDSHNAILWVKNKKCKTKLQKNKINAELFDAIERAEKWLCENELPNKILKWHTSRWGEIPADYGRK